MSKFVVESQGLGEWRRGDVLSDEQLTANGGSLERLLGLRSIRPATELESELTHVDLPGERLNLSYQQKMADQDLMIARLQDRIRQLEEEKASRNVTTFNPTDPVSPHAVQAPVIQEKDKAIQSLQQQLREAQAGRQQKEKDNSPERSAARQQPTTVKQPS